MSRVSDSTDLATLGVLAEPQRRRIYEYVAAAPAPVTRNELADVLHIGRTLVAFHLDKLRDAGFVEPVPIQAEQGRLGRPSQRYRATRRELSASVPPRHYDLVAEVLLLAATERSQDESIDHAAKRVAERRGRALALQLRPRASARTVRAKLERLRQLLSRLGYAPRPEGQSLALGNCPFEKLRDVNCELVCAINYGLSHGYVDGLGAGTQIVPRLHPCVDSCCVVFDLATAG